MLFQDVAGIGFKDFTLEFRQFMFLCTTLKCIEFAHKICDFVDKIWDFGFKSRIHRSTDSA